MSSAPFPSLGSMRQKAEDRAARFDELVESDEQYLALVKVNPHVFLALLDVLEAAEEFVEARFLGTRETLEKAVRRFNCAD